MTKSTNFYYTKLYNSVPSYLEKSRCEGFSSVSIDKAKVICINFIEWMEAQNTTHSKEAIKQAVSIRKQLFYGIRRNEKFIYWTLNRFCDFIDGKDFSTSVHEKPSYDYGVYTNVVNNYLTNCQKKNALETMRHKKYHMYKITKAMSLNNISSVEKLNSLDSNLLVAQSLKNSNERKTFRDFLFYLFKTNILKMNYGELIVCCRHTNKVIPVYSIEEIEKMRKSINTTTAIGKRSLAIFLLGSRLGIRISDIVGLKKESVNFDDKTISFIQKKTKQLTNLPLPEDCATALKDYLSCQERAKYQSDYIFLRLRPPVCHPISPTEGDIIMHTCLEKAQINIGKRGRGFHTLRSSLASNLVNSGASFGVVSDILGHSNIDTLNSYAQLKAESLRKCASELPEAKGAIVDFVREGRM